MRPVLPILTICLIASLPATAFSATILSGVEGMTTTVFQEQQTSFSGLGLRATFQSDALVPGFAFLPGIEYWRNSTRVKTYQISAERRDATLALDARYAFHYRNIAPYLGAGFGVHFLTTEVAAPSLGLPYAEDALIKGGAAAFGGVLFPLGGKLQNFIELKYHHVTDYTQYKLNLGIAYGF